MDGSQLLKHPLTQKDSRLCLENLCPDPQTTYCYCHHRKQKTEEHDWGNADPAPRENLSLVSSGLLSGTDTWLAEQRGEIAPSSHLAAHKGRVFGLCRWTRAGDKRQRGCTRKIQLPAPLTWDQPHAAAIQPDFCHLPLVHTTQDMQPDPLRQRQILPRPSRINRVWPPTQLSRMG